MQCPVCEAENPDDVVECGSCGRAMAPGSGEGEGVRHLEGLEFTQVAAPDLAVQVEAVAGLEPTHLEADTASSGEWTPGQLALERTQHEGAAGAVPAWTPVEVDRGREPDSRERTPVPPETAICPWCGANSFGTMCDSCGRRKSRYAAPPPEREARPGETVTCPECFARVVREVRCPECGMPFPLQEL